MDPITLYTTIRSDVKRRELLRAILFVSCGAFLIVLGGAVVAMPHLSIWGAILWIAAILIILAGILPYRKLANLDSHPSDLLLSDQAIYYQLLDIPYDSIEEIRYVNTPPSYGISIAVRGVPTPYFFPYFSEESFLTLQETWKAKIAEKVEK